MREIKFRGKAINRKDTWFVGDLRHCNRGRVWVFPLDDEAGIDKHRVDPNTVGQCTDLYDKNGKEIYCGDVLDSFGGAKYEVICGDGEYQTRRITAIPKPEGLRLSTIKAIDRLTKWDLRYFEIIGNIHDNPDLI